MTKGYRILVFLIIACLLTAGSSAVCLAQSTEFYFVDTEAKRGRLFDITLCARNNSDIAAFEAEVTYDADCLEYRNCTPSGDNVEVRVNSSENGLLRIVFLCEDGMDAVKDTELITFSFKALEEGSCSLSAQISGLINTDFEDADATVHGGCVIVSAPHVSGEAQSDKKAESSENSEADTENESDAQAKGSSTYTDPANSSVVIIVIIVVLIFLSVAGVVVYKIIALRKNKSKEETDEISDRKPEETSLLFSEEDSDYEFDDESDDDFEETEYED